MELPLLIMIRTVTLMYLFVSEDGNENVSRLLQNTNNGNFIDVTEKFWNQSKSKS